MNTNSMVRKRVTPKTGTGNTLEIHYHQKPHLHKRYFPPAGRLDQKVWHGVRNRKGELKVAPSGLGTLVGIQEKSYLTSVTSKAAGRGKVWVFPRRGGEWRK